MDVFLLLILSFFLILVLAFPTESIPNPMIFAISSTLICTIDNRQTLYSVSFKDG